METHNAASDPSAEKRWKRQWPKGPTGNCSGVEHHPYAPTVLGLFFFLASVFALIFASEVSTLNQSCIATFVRASCDTGRKDESCWGARVDQGCRELGGGDGYGRFKARYMGGSPADGRGSRDGVR